MNGMRAAKESLEERFDRYWQPEPNSGCWLWTGSTAHDYGALSSYPPKRRLRAHRYAYLRFRGPIPDGACVCHKCDVRSCVNPDHLFLGTNKDNTDDMMRKGRNKTFKGETHGRSKLAAQQVESILADHRPHSEVAKDYSVAYQTIWRIKTGRNWRAM